MIPNGSANAWWAPSTWAVANAPNAMVMGPSIAPTALCSALSDMTVPLPEYLTLPEANLLEVPEQVSDEQAVFTEPLAAALRIRDQVRNRPSDRVAVVGPGRLGSIIGQVLALDGTDVTLLGRRAESLERATGWGLSAGLVADAADNAFDVVVEATGNQAGLAESLRIVRPKGHPGFKKHLRGLHHPGPNQVGGGRDTGHRLPMRAVRTGSTLVGTRGRGRPVHDPR